MGKATNLIGGRTGNMRRLVTMNLATLLWALPVFVNYAPWAVDHNTPGKQPRMAILLLAYLATLSTNTRAQDLPDPLAAGWQGNDVCELLERNERLRVLRCTFPPGVGHERHFHAPHYGYALSGGVMKLIDERGTRIVTLETGSDFSSAGTPWHTVLNVGDTTVQYLIIEPK